MQTFYDNIEYEVLTPNGFQFFDGLLVTEDKDVIVWEYNGENDELVQIK